MPHRCAILDDYQNIALQFADWSPLKGKVDIKVFNEAFASQADAISALKDFEIICAMRERTPFPREVIAALPNLKLLITSGMRNAAFDLDALREHGVVVCGTGGVGNATAGLTIGLMLELTRHIGRENAIMHAGGPWQTTMGRDVEGMTLGIVGLGKLGKKVASIAQALGMNVIAWSENLTKDACDAAGVAYATKQELFSTADIVSIHVVLSSRTRGFITREDLSRMKPSAYLVNAARAAIVDEAALLEALQKKKIAGAGLDVFSQEPLPADHPLRKLDNVVLTPHIGYVTDENYRRYYADMAECIGAWLDGKPVRVMG